MHTSPGRSEAKPWVSRPPRTEPCRAAHRGRWLATNSRTWQRCVALAGLVILGRPTQGCRPGLVCDAPGGARRTQQGPERAAPATKESVPVFRSRSRWLRWSAMPGAGRSGSGEALRQAGVLGPLGPFRPLGPCLPPAGSPWHLRNRRAPCPRADSPSWLRRGRFQS